MRRLLSRRLLREGGVADWDRKGVEKGVTIGEGTQVCGYNNDDNNMIN